MSPTTVQVTRSCCWRKLYSS